MVNITVLATNYFVMDLPDVQWTGLAGYEQVTVRVTITPLNGSMVQFHEKYIPDADGAVTLRGLAALVQPYVAPSPTELRAVNITADTVSEITCTRAALNICLLDQDGNDGIGPSKLCHVYYSNQKTDTYPGSIRKWLSRYTERTLYKMQRITASAFLLENISARLNVAYVKDGLLQTETVSVPVPAQTASTPPVSAFLLCYSLEKVAREAGCGVDDIRIIDVQLLDGNDVADTIRYRVDNESLPKHNIVAFTNCYGMFEMEVFTGTDERSVNMDAEYSWIDEQYEKIAEEVITEHKLCAGHVSGEKHLSICDIAQAPKVAIVYKGEGCVLSPEKYEPMTVTAIEINDKKPHTAPHTAYVTLRHAPRHHEVVSRNGDSSPTFDDGIFDYTFDNTYN